MSTASFENGLVLKNDAAEIVQNSLQCITLGPTVNVCHLEVLVLATDRLRWYSNIRERIPCLFVIVAIQESFKDSSILWNLFVAEQLPIVLIISPLFQQIFK